MRMSDWSSDVCSSDLGLDLLLDLRRALQRGLLGLPHFLQVVVLALERLDRGFKIRQALPGFGVLLLLQRLALDLELDQASLLAVEFLRLGVDLHADARGGFVHQVDGLVGQRSEEHTSELQSLKRISNAVLW